MGIGPLVWAWGDLIDHAEDPGPDLEYWYLLLRSRKGLVFAMALRLRSRRRLLHLPYWDVTLAEKSARCQALACTYGVLPPPTTRKASVFVQASELLDIYP